MKMTIKNLEKYGFKPIVTGHPPHLYIDMYKKDDIGIFAYDDKWFIEALDKVGIDVNIETIEELDLFFKACKRKLL